MASDQHQPNAWAVILSTNMRVLSIRQPWAYFICEGTKKTENRSWSTDYRGPVLIHAGQRWADEAVETIEQRFGLSIPRDLPRGGIVGIAGLVDIVTASDDPFFTGPFGFVMVGAQPLPFMPHPGALGLRTPPSEIVDRIDSAILKQVDEAVRHWTK